MTAVAPPPNFQNISRHAPNGQPPMSSDDYRHMFMQPRKTLQRANSTSSLNSNASASTVIAPSPQPNGAVGTPTSDASTWAARKKAPRGLWPASKNEPVSGITTARPQGPTIVPSSSGTSAASAMSALTSPMLPSQHNAAPQAGQVNGGPRTAPKGDAPAILHLIPLNGTFERKTITVPFFPDVLRIGRQTNNKTIPTPTNGYFDSKVLSRQHAEIWADQNGKIWIRDVKSSNGTFVNTHRLSQENRDSDPHELREKDTLELGIDIVSEDQKTIVHHKVAARVEHAGIYPNLGTNFSELSFGDVDNAQSNYGQQQAPNMRGRAPSQGLVGGRLQPGPGGMPPSSAMQPRHPNFWLQPVSMDQVVKKLNSEIRAAKIQNIELQATHQFINSILATEPKKESISSGSQKHKVSPIKDLKSRFSEPPAPPPQQPLPEKPDAPSIRRSDTERPLSMNSPIRADARISSLADALSSAKREIEAQSARVHDLETLLNQERRAREDAEERANRLEQQSLNADIPSETDGSKQTSGNLTLDEVLQDTLPHIPTSPTLPDVAAAHLQSRLEAMMNEMAEMKQQMEKYRQRAEDAEAERDTHRQTLAEMVEKIRQDDAKTAAKEAARQRRRSNSNGALSSTSTAVDGAGKDSETEEGEITILNEKEVVDPAEEAALSSGLLKEERLANGSLSAGHSKAARALATRQPHRSDMAMTHGGPAVSIITVVALGVALMAWLNSNTKIER